QWESIAALHRSIWPNPVEVNEYVKLANGDDYDSKMMFVCGQGSSTIGGNLATAKMPSLYLPLSVVTASDYSGAAITSATQWHVNINGWGPHQTMYLPMSALQDGRLNTVRTTDYGRIDLKVTTGAAAGVLAYSKVVAEYSKPNLREV
ncbi:unnamed protein product, partial [marine sediment metagenome]